MHDASLRCDSVAIRVCDLRRDPMAERSQHRIERATVWSWILLVPPPISSISGLPCGKDRPARLPSSPPRRRRPEIATLPEGMPDTAKRSFLAQQPRLFES